MPFQNLSIAFDAKRAAQNRTGLGNYSRFVIRSLSRFSSVGRLLLYAPDLRKVQALDGVDEEQRVSMRYPKGFWAERHNSLWRIWGITNRLKTDKIRLFHGLSNELPLNIRKAKGLRTIVTIHDLVFRIHPECYHFFDRIIYNFKFRRACHNADRIIAVSECTKRDIVRFYSINPDKIDVVYQGCDERFAIESSQSEVDAVRQQYNLPEHFILYLGSIERRKNLLLLAQALKHLPADVQVIAVGQRTPYASQVRKYLKAQGLESRMKLLTRVPFAALPALYRMAGVFVYPSRYEGFGIPILEALTCGTPVVACTGSCLEEAGGPSSLYVSPDDPLALAHAISSILSNPTLRQKMIADGLAYAKRFQPEELTRQLLQVYQKVMPDTDAENVQPLTPRPKISVVINTYNAASVIRPTLQSVRAFDEVLVCDMESTDDTVAVATEYGCRVVTFPKRNYNICEPARDFAIHAAANRWVLVVDADEVVTPQLRHYLYQAAERDEVDALLISRKNFFLGRFSKENFPDYQLRFFKNELATWPPTIHSRPEIRGKVGRLPLSHPELALVHAPETMRQRIAKLNSYSDSEVTRRRGKHVGSLALIFKPAFRFFKAYFLKGGIRGGKAGFISACSDAIYKFWVLAKLYEDRQKK